MITNKEKTLRKVIIVLSVLLAISIIALGCTLYYRFEYSIRPTTVTIPDNLITSEKEYQSETSQGTFATNDNSTQQAAPAAAAKLYLHAMNTGDNVPFNVLNMFPGDSITKYYCVRVSYTNSVTVHHHEDIREGYEKLAEVLKCRIVLLSTNETLYDGLMRDMPKSIPQTVTATGNATTDLYYEITAYLDTSVGNEYQDKTLIADFRWWIEEEDIGNLRPPQTGDNTQLVVYGVIAGVSLLVLIWVVVILIKKRRREETLDGK